MPGWAASNCLPSSVNDSVSDAAAKHGDVARQPTVASCSRPRVDPRSSRRRSVLDPHPARPTDDHGRGGEDVTAERRIRLLLRSSPRRGQGFRRYLDRDVGGLHGRDGEHPRFQAQLVDGLAAQQRDEPVRAGLDLDLGHDGVPHDAGDQAGEPVAHGLRDDWTRLELTRLRVRDSSAKSASAAPSITSRPDSSVVVSIRPASAHRRTVSSLTPSSSAASLIRNTGTSGL